jgi:hypothetical protein
LASAGVKAPGLGEVPAQQITQNQEPPTFLVPAKDVYLLGTIQQGRPLATGQGVVSLLQRLLALVFQGKKQR